MSILFYWLFNSSVWLHYSSASIWLWSPTAKQYLDRDIVIKSVIIDWLFGRLRQQQVQRQPQRGQHERECRPDPERRLRPLRHQRGSCFSRRLLLLRSGRTPLRERHPHHRQPDGHWLVPNLGREKVPASHSRYCDNSEPEKNASLQAIIHSKARSSTQITEIRETRALENLFESTNHSQANDEALEKHHPSAVRLSHASGSQMVPQVEVAGCEAAKHFTPH